MEAKFSFTLAIRKVKYPRINFIRNGQDLCASSRGWKSNNNIRLSLALAFTVFVCWGWSEVDDFLAEESNPWKERGTSFCRKFGL